MAAQEPQSQPSITVFRGWDDPGKLVWSPYVIKLEARLRFAGLSYTTEADSTRQSPKGKIPYIDYEPASVQGTASSAEATGVEKQRLSDSTLIIKALTERDVLPDLNAALTPAECTHDLALRALLEEKLYFYHSIPFWPMRYLIGLLIHRSTTATLHGQGTGRYSPDEIAALRREIWDGVGDLLVASRCRSRSSGGAAKINEKEEEEPFWVLGGAAPTEADACLFGFIVSVLICAAGPDSQDVVRSVPVLLDYASRIHDRYFPDYEKWT
ncbi:Uu.00g130690.m01.CDS01 [Anthostomella pinea]|uniref:Uu.00g130690.m01.CDS01 n=1 Tax=Anthostomella pinea TaxID=933095 RepID=A0AAI8VIR3_9PEZI|nr:Uu.00g130690.m01.CDS01 [Anthostomella pinea]